MSKRPSHLQRAQTATRESKHVDFKGQFNPTSDGDWCELIKDIIAFANSDGGAIVFGLSDDGRPVPFDPRPILECDLADITNKISRYTDVEFADLEITTVDRAGGACVAMVISPSDVPIPFSKPGSYDMGTARPKTAFARGTLYFRHGAKSEPANHLDLIGWRDREVARVRKEWLGGIRQVVQAPPGHTVTVVPSGGPAAAGPVVRGSISTSGKGTKVVVQNADEIWPYRQQELLREIQKKLPSLKLSSYDVQCANWKLDTLKSHREFAFKSHPKASPQYSPAYVDWFVEQGQRDLTFFQKLRDERHLSRKAA